MKTKSTLGGNVKYYPHPYYISLYGVVWYDMVWCCVQFYRIILLVSLQFFPDSLESPAIRPRFALIFLLLLFRFSFTASVFFLCPNNCCFAKFNKTLVYSIPAQLFLYRLPYICAHKRASLICLACKFVGFFSLRWSGNGCGQDTSYKI